MQSQTVLISYLSSALVTAWLYLKIWIFVLLAPFYILDCWRLDNVLYTSALNTVVYCPRLQQRVFLVPYTLQQQCLHLSRTHPFTRVAIYIGRNPFPSIRNSYRECLVKCCHGIIKLSPSAGWRLSSQRQHRETRIDSLALSDIRTHSPSVWVIKIVCTLLSLGQFPSLASTACLF